MEGAKYTDRITLERAMKGRLNWMTSAGPSPARKVCDFFLNAANLSTISSKA